MKIVIDISEKESRFEGRVQTSADREKELDQVREAFRDARGTTVDWKAETRLRDGEISRLKEELSAATEEIEALNLADQERVTTIAELQHCLRDANSRVERVTRRRSSDENEIKRLKRELALAVVRGQEYKKAGS